MPDCVVCSKSRLPKQLHTFTSKARLREQWMTALTNDDSEKARLDITLRTAKARQFVCEDHFAEESFDITPNSRVLKVNAIPMSKVQLFISNSLYHTNKLSTISTIRPFSEGLADRNLPYSYSYCRQLASAHSLSLCFLPLQWLVLVLLLSRPSVWPLHRSLRAVVAAASRRLLVTRFILFAI